MASEKHHKVEEKIEKARAICEAYSAGNLTLDSCCENQGVAPRTFIYWRDTVAEVADLFKEAAHKADLATRSRLVFKSLTSMEKLIEGYTVEEITQEGIPVYDENGNQTGIKIKAVKKTKKHVSPHPTMIIFALKSLTDRFKGESPGQSPPQEQVFLIGGKEVRF